MTRSPAPENLAPVVKLTPKALKRDGSGEAPLTNEKRAAIVDFFTNPKDAYSLAEIQALASHPDIRQLVKSGDLVPIDPKKRGAARRFTRDGVESVFKHVLAGWSRDILAIALILPEVERITVPRSWMIDLLESLLRQHEQSHCVHTWAEPVGDYPAACKWCRVSSDGNAHPEMKHRSVALPRSFDRPDGAHMCVLCFATDKPGYGVRRPSADEQRAVVIDELRARMNQFQARLEASLSYRIR